MDGVFHSPPFSFGGFEILNTFSSSQGFIEEDFIQIIPSFAAKNISLSGVALGVRSFFNALLELDGVENSRAYKRPLWWFEKCGDFNFSRRQSGRQ